MVNAHIKGSYSVLLYGFSMQNTADFKMYLEMKTCQNPGESKLLEVNKWVDALNCW